MCSKILQYLIICVILSQCSVGKELEDGKSSLVFVFDTTGSMYNDLRQLREGAEMILKTALEEGNIGDFVFVPFHDPAVGPATVTQDKDVFKNALEMVHVYGGGDCPEKSLGGIQLALDVSKAKSYVYVFTDATAGDHRLVGKVLDGVQRKQSQVVFVLTGHCNDLDKPSFKVYQQIAAASAGQVFNLNKTSVHKVLDFVKSSLKGKMVNLGSSVKPAGSNYSQEIPVDSTLGEVTVSVSGAKPQITVVDPSGEQLTGPPKLITTLDLSEIMVVKVMQPEPGNWTITVGSDEDYSVKVSGLSNLTFDHGFSVEKPKDLAETSYRPLKGTYNHMLVGLTEKNLQVTIEFAEILSMTGSTLFELPLTEVDTDNKVYMADAFIPPDEEFFYIAINGRDEHGQPLRRIGTTAVQAKVPDVPFLTTMRKISAHAHSRVVLKCKVDSMVPLTAMWTKNSHKLQPQISSLQTTTIEFVIEDLTEEKVGAYKCFGKNVAGVTKAVTQVSIIVDPPQVSIEPANKTLALGDNITITCTVLSEALLLDFRFISNLKAKGTNLKVEPNIDGTYTFIKTIVNADETDAGTYTCIAANKGGGSNQSTTISVQSRPSAQILGPHSLSKTIHTTAQIVCQVDNCHTVKWVHNSMVVKESVVNASSADVLELNVTDDGTWMCVAVRGDIEVSDTIQITVNIKPSVSIKGEKEVTILNGTIYELVCEVNAKPPPRITWHREIDQFLDNSITQLKPNLYKSVLTLNSSKEKVEATYFCNGENSEGVTHDHVKVNVRRKASVVKGLIDISEKLYSSVKLNCLIDSHPPVQTTWYHNGTLLHSSENILISDDNSNLSIKRLDFNDLGVYSCEAYNGFERVKLNGTLSVHGLESPVIMKEPTKITAVKGETTLITCSVQGSPEPTINWKFKHSNADSFTELQNMSKSELNIPATLENEGIYQCIAENVVGRDTFDVQFTVHYPPEIKTTNDPENINNMLQVQADNKLALSCNVLGVPPPIVFWTKDKRPVKFSKNVHLIDDSLVIEEATIDDSGHYICNASSSLGSVQKNFTVLVYETPKITSKGEQIDVLEGELVEMACEAKGSPKPVISWEQNGVPITEERKFVDEFGIRFIANLTDFGNYTCRAKNNYGDTSVTYSLYVWVPPSIKGSLESTIEVLVGDDVSLQCNAVGFPIPTIEWSFQLETLTENTTEMSFNDVGSLNISKASSKHEGTYVCVAHNMNGIDNKYFHVNVNEPPKILDDNYTGPYLATNLDTAVTIACMVTGKPNPYILWSKDGVYLHKDSQYIVGKDGTLTIKSPSEDMSGNYTCTAKNKFGVVNKTVPVEVYSLPTHEQSEQSHSKATVLEHSDASVECPLRASVGDTVQWYKDADLVSTGVLTLPKVSRASQATYACVVTNKVGSAYSTVTVNVEWPPDFVEENSDNDLTKNVNTEKDEGSHKDAENTENDLTKDVGTNKDEVSNKDAENTENYLTKENTENDLTKDVGTNKDEVSNKDAGNTKNDLTKENTEKDKTSDNDEDTAEGTDVTKQTNIDDEDNEEEIDGKDKNESNKKDSSDNTKNILNTKESNVKTVTDKEVTGSKYTDEKSFKDVIKVVEVVKGDDAFLDCKTDAMPQARTKWLHNSKPIIFEDKPYLRLINVQKHNAGNYKCIATNTHGSVHRMFELNVSVPPFISDFDVLDVSLMEGSVATLECNAQGHPEPSIKWTFKYASKDNTNWLLENSTLTAVNMTVDSEGIFRCDAKNKAGTRHIVYRVSVVSPADVQDIMAFQNGEGITVERSFEAGLGSHIRLACKATGKPTPNIQWLRNGKVLSVNAQDIDYADLILDVEKSDAGVYSCIVTNIGGSGERSIKLEVLEPPKIFQSIIQTAPTLEVLSGQSYNLHCHPLGNPSPEIYWFKDNLPLKLFDDSMVSTEYGEVIAVKSAKVEQMGNYTCVARSRVGNASVSYLVDVVVPPPQPKESSKPVSARVGKPLILTCPVEGAPLPVVTWIKHPYTEIGEANPRITLMDYNVTLSINRTQVSDSGNYSCIMTNKAGTTEVVYTVTIEKAPSIAGNASSEEHVVALWRSVVLKCEADGHPLPKINWLKDTQKLSATSSNVHLVLGNSLLALWRVTSRDAGQYICVVENDAGTAHRRYNVAISVPGKWSSWSEWSFCNVTCGLGQQLRTRTCQYIDEDNNIIDKNSKPDRIVVDESACKGPVTERRKCQMPPCEEVGSGWLNWSRWYPCSATCGRGTQARTRKCKNKLCQGDNVQIRKCVDLPKCNSNEDISDNDVYSREGSKENPYIPEAVFEKQPEILNSLYSPDVELFYTAGGSLSSKASYDVNVTHNLDGSDMGSCRPGFRPTGIDNSACKDIDECELENNHCHSTQVCENTEGAYRCTCSPGYLSLGAGQRCMDINECSQDTSGCEFACVNTAGGYVCACPAHMRLHADKHHCYTTSYEDLDNSEYLSTSVEYPARYKHIRSI